MEEVVLGLGLGLVGGGGAEEGGLVVGGLGFLPQLFPFLLVFLGLGLGFLSLSLGLGLGLGLRSFSIFLVPLSSSDFRNFSRLFSVFLSVSSWWLSSCGEGQKGKVSSLSWMVSSSLWRSRATVR